MTWKPEAARIGVTSAKLWMSYGPAVDEDDRRAVGRAGLDVADVQHAGVDLLDRPERDGRRLSDEPSRSVIVASARCAIERRTSVPAALSPARRPPAAA
jgi:hypothetical protein